MHKWKEEWKKLIAKDGLLHSRKLYIAAGICVVVLVVGMVALSGLQPQEVVLMGEATQTPTVIPTPGVGAYKLPPRASEVPVPTKTPLPRETQPPATPQVDTVATDPGPVKLTMPVVGDVIQPFSIHELVKSKTTGDWQVHKGVDIKSDLSTAVQAAADGVVAEAYLDDLYGNTIVIDHGQDTKTLYANLSGLDMVTVGETVKAGQTISGVGDSAPIELLEEAHLHFALLVGGEWQDPMQHMQ